MDTTAAHISSELNGRLLIVQNLKIVLLRGDGQAVSKVQGCYAAIPYIPVHFVSIQYVPVRYFLKFLRPRMFHP
jgi:hypothetical protein